GLASLRVELAGVPRPGPDVPPALHRHAHPALGVAEEQARGAVVPDALRRAGGALHHQAGAVPGDRAGERDARPAAAAGNIPASGLRPSGPRFRASLPAARPVLILPGRHAGLEAEVL